jgi:hypothetical protein
MSNIKLWSTTAGNNNASPPDGWPEGQAPSSVNNCAREMMASLKTWHEEVEWTDFDDTPTFATTANFTVSGDYSARYQIGRRLRASGVSNIYGTINDVTFSATTRVSVDWDSGEMSASFSLTSVAVGAISRTNTGMPRRGMVIGVDHTATGAVATGTTQLPFDDTIPQNTEGDEYLTITVTPSHAKNKLVIESVCYFASTSTAEFQIAMALFQDTTANALAAGYGTRTNQNGVPCAVVLRHEMTAGTTSATTFKVRAGTDGAGTTTFNGIGGKVHGWSNGLTYNCY